MSTTKKPWDEPIPNFPKALYMQPVGANRAQRRKMREHKNDPTPPSSMAPAVKRLVTKKRTIASKHEAMREVQIPTGEVEYVASR